jgi:hypothetical protein
MDTDSKNGVGNDGQNPLAPWLQTLNFFEATPNEAHLDDTVYLIKQYARLQISSLQQLRRDYKDLFGQATNFIKTNFSQTAFGRFLRLENSIFSGLFLSTCSQTSAQA